LHSDVHRNIIAEPDMVVSEMAVFQPGAPNMRWAWPEVLSFAHPTCLQRLAA
jgi:hypothetical protein